MFVIARALTLRGGVDQGVIVGYLLISAREINNCIHDTHAWLALFIAVHVI